MYVLGDELVMGSWFMSIIRDTEKRLDLYVDEYIPSYEVRGER